MGEFIGKITQIKDETPDVKTFRIGFGEIINFIPGQYCLVSLPDNKATAGIERPLTYVNIPGQKYVELTVKKMGLFTSSLFSMKKGDNIKIRGPFGKALNFDETITRDVVFLAGGSGITPFIAAIRYSIARKMANKLTLIFGNRTEKDIIYRKELDKLHAEGRVNIVNVLSQPEDWNGKKGYISEEIIKEYVDKPKEKIWYVCGPPAMMNSMRELLNKINIPEENLKIENWIMPGKSDIKA